MKINSQHYQESGKINYTTFILTSLISITIAATLGYVYNLLIIIIPIIYLNLLITLGLGIVLGFCTRVLIRLSKTRNTKSKYVLALFFGLSTIYFQWVAYFGYALNTSVPSLSEYFTCIYTFINPSSFVGMLLEINQFGLWSLMDMNFKGVGLTAIWIVEAFIILTGSIVAVLKTKIYPYSELNNKWFSKYTFERDFISISGVNKLKEDLAINPVSTVERLGNGTGIRHSKIHLFYEKGENEQFLTLEKVFIEDHGKGKKQSEIVLNNFKIDNSAALTLLKRVPNRKETYSVF